MHNIFNHDGKKAHLNSRYFAQIDCSKLALIIDKQYVDKVGNQGHTRTIHIYRTRIGRMRVALREPGRNVADNEF